MSPLHRFIRSSFQKYFYCGLRRPRGSPRLLTRPWGLTQALFSTAASRDDLYYPVNEDIEELTRQCMTQLLPKYAHYLEPSSLDMEFGEASIWDRQQAQYDTEMNDLLTTPNPFQAKETADKNIFQEFREKRASKESVSYLIQSFDPQAPPASDQLDDLQLWLECEAQRESVRRYQAALNSARDRQDYGSLSMVQRQIVHWFSPLVETLAERQRDYILKNPGTPSSAKDSVDGRETSSVAYSSATGQNIGPFLCALPSEKLAVIVAHEAIMSCAATKKEDGISFGSLAFRIGQAVEEEVLIHRALHKRFQNAQKSRADRRQAERLDQGEKNTESTEEVDSSAVLGSIKSRLGKAAPLLQKELEATHKWSYAASHLKNYLEEIQESQPSAKRRRIVTLAVRRARMILEKEEDWTTAIKVQLGAALFQALLDRARVNSNGNQESAFIYETKWMSRKNKTMGVVRLHDKLFDMFVSDEINSLSANTNRHKPMVVPPKPWVAPASGGYEMLNVDLMRFHGSNTQREALGNADLTTVYDGLNALGRVPWRINLQILEVAQRCWAENVALGDIPSRTDFEVPPEPAPPGSRPEGLDPESPAYQQYLEDVRTYRTTYAKYRRVLQKNNDLRSLRCSAMLKLDQAEKFKEFEEIYFPYNMDFRGRAYPIPPHLSNIGSDLCRGMLRFAEAKPLGDRGLYWLKVHLANFAGKDKMTFDDRAKFVDEHMDLVNASAANPMAETWWQELEDPFQGLATCFEIVNAVDSGDPASYECSLPVHMDGSCNGLQHYAALGRDRIGGKAVNLCDYDEPQDVYVGVMHEVIRRVAEEAATEVDFAGDTEKLSHEQRKALQNNQAAKLVDGLIDRGVVKRTVMTSVYGVTYIGARQQIKEKIESKLKDKGHDVDEIEREIFQACGYLASVTMDVIGDLFQGAKGTMNWLAACARMITHRGYPVAWISPIGLPAIQPYRQRKSATLVTLMQSVTLVDESDDLPIHKGRQVTAFPPNYVHSLDSSHMLLTALEMDRRGLAFSAVHDSFWTHACDVDEMNVALREVFVDLYEQPLLEQLKQTWELRYPDLAFPDLPERGNLDLTEVKRAKYFFQ